MKICSRILPPILALSLAAATGEAGGWVERDVELRTPGFGNIKKTHNVFTYDPVNDEIEAISLVKEKKDNSKGKIVKNLQSILTLNNVDKGVFSRNEVLSFFHNIKAFSDYNAGIKLNDFLFEQVEVSKKDVTEILNFIANSPYYKYLTNYAIRYPIIFSDLMRTVNGKDMTPHLFYFTLEMYQHMNSKKLHQYTKILRSLCAEFLFTATRENLLFDDIYNSETNRIILSPSKLYHRGYDEHLSRFHMLFYAVGADSEIFSKGNYSVIEYFLSLKISPFRFQNNSTNVYKCDNPIFSNMRSNKSLSLRQVLILTESMIDSLDYRVPSSCYFKDFVQEAGWYTENLKNNYTEDVIEKWNFFTERLSSNTEEAFHYAIQKLKKQMRTNMKVIQPTVTNKCPPHILEPMIDELMETQEDTEDQFCRRISKCDDITLDFSKKDAADVSLFFIATSICDNKYITKEHIHSQLQKQHVTWYREDVHDEIASYCLNQESVIPACHSLKEMHDSPYTPFNIYDTASAYEKVLAGRLRMMNDWGFKASHILSSRNVENYLTNLNEASLIIVLGEADALEVLKTIDDSKLPIVLSSIVRAINRVDEDSITPMALNSFVNNLDYYNRLHNNECKSSVSYAYPLYGALCATFRKFPEYLSNSSDLKHWEHTAMERAEQFSFRGEESLKE